MAYLPWPSWIGRAKIHNNRTKFIIWGTDTAHTHRGENIISTFVVIMIRLDYEWSLSFSFSTPQKCQILFNVSTSFHLSSKQPVKCLFFYCVFGIILFWTDTGKTHKKSNSSISNKQVLTHILASYQIYLTNVYKSVSLHMFTVWISVICTDKDPQ